MRPCLSQNEKKNVTQTSLKLSILLPHPPQSLDYRPASSCPATHTLSIISGLLIMPETRQTDVTLCCSGEVPQGMMWLVQNKRKPFLQTLPFPCCLGVYVQTILILELTMWLSKMCAHRVEMELTHCPPSCLC